MKTKTPNLMSSSGFALSPFFKPAVDATFAVRVVQIGFEPSMFAVGHVFRARHLPVRAFALDIIPAKQTLQISTM